MTKGPQGGKGKYELKQEFYSSYNPYFYHYTKGDKSKVSSLYSCLRKGDSIHHCYINIQYGSSNLRIIMIVVTSHEQTLLIDVLTINWTDVCCVLNT